MIRFSDAAVLAYTKLRAHRIRTGITVGIAGILFGLILAVLFVVQGIFDSIGRFSDVGLNNRSIIAISYFDSANLDRYNYAYDDAFVAKVEKLYEKTVAAKKVAAKKYNVSYDQASEDPSPLAIDSETKKKYITQEALYGAYVDKVLAAQATDSKKFDINEYLAQYSSASVLPVTRTVAAMDGSLQYMKNGKEPTVSSGQNMYANTGEDPVLSVIDGSVTQPFIATTSYDPVKGELPVILPYSQAEKLLGLTALKKTASNEARLERMHEIRDRLGEVTVSFCYRNQASTQLLSEATSQEELIKKNAGKADFVMPSVQYKTPSDSSCGAVATTKDARTATEKADTERYIAYQKEVGTYIGKPAQQKITLRAVGISADVAGTGSLSSVGDAVNSLLGSNLGYNMWVIPSDLLAKVPADSKPEAVFPANSNPTDTQGYTSYLVEFGNKEEARSVLSRTGAFSNSNTGNVYSYPFGSGVLVVDEMKKYFNTFMFWALIIVGSIAAVILGGIIGRTISEGRRESAVFRAIGAKRGDVAGIYGVYALLLSARVAVFALVLGAVMSLIVELLFSRDATLGARVAYAAADTSAEFHFFGVTSWYIPLVLAVIIVVGCVGSVLPIIRNARRNPINDMRDE